MTSHKIFYKHTHLLRNIRPLVALFTYLQETLVVPQHCQMSFIDNTILKLSLLSCTTRLLCIKALFPVTLFVS